MHHRNINSPWLLWFHVVAKPCQLFFSKIWVWMLSSSSCVIAIELLVIKAPQDRINSNYSNFLIDLKCIVSSVLKALFDPWHLWCLLIVCWHLFEPYLVHFSIVIFSSYSIIRKSWGLVVADHIIISESAQDWGIREALLDHGAYVSL